MTGSPADRGPTHTPGPPADHPALPPTSAASTIHRVPGETVSGSVFTHPQCSRRFPRRGARTALRQQRRAGQRLAGRCRSRRAQDRTATLPRPRRREAERSQSHQRSPRRTRDCPRPSTSTPPPTQGTPPGPQFVPPGPGRVSPHVFFHEGLVMGVTAFAEIGSPLPVLARLLATLDVPAPESDGLPPRCRLEKPCQRRSARNAPGR